VRWRRCWVGKGAKSKGFTCEAVGVNHEGSKSGVDLAGADESFTDRIAAAIAHGLHHVGEDELVVVDCEVEGGVAYFSDVVEDEAIAPIPGNTIVHVKTRLISLFTMKTPKMNEIGSARMTEPIITNQQSLISATTR
jgi:hypothetical protein